MFRSTVLTLALVFGSLTATPVVAQTANPSASSTARTESANPPSMAQKTTLTVSIAGVRNDRGQILIWLWNGPEGFPKKGDKSYKLFAIDANKAVNKTVTTTFDIPPGVYAVTVLHDANRNGKMDTNFLGMPTEGLGTSNNVVSHFRAPSFKQVSFEVPAAGQKILISLRY